MWLVENKKTKKRFLYYDKLLLKIFSNGEIGKGPLIRDVELIVNYANFSKETAEEIDRLFITRSYLETILKRKETYLLRKLFKSLEWVYEDDERKLKLS